jgi:hypothetical protein
MTGFGPEEDDMEDSNWSQESQMMLLLENLALLL